MPSNSPASQLLARSHTVVVQGPRPVRQRSLQTLALAGLVLMGSALSVDEAEAAGRYQRNPQISAEHFDRADALSVNEAARGRVIAINRVNVEPEKGLDARTVGGAIIGGLVGNQVGAGRGRKISLGLGALAGGLLGNKSNRKANAEPSVEIFVEINTTDRRGNPTGVQTVSIVQREDQDIRPGDDVFIVESGRSTRIVPIRSEVEPRAQAVSSQFAPEEQAWLSQASQLNAQEAPTNASIGSRLSDRRQARDQGGQGGDRLMSGDFESTPARPKGP